MRLHTGIQLRWGRGETGLMVAAARILLNAGRISVEGRFFVYPVFGFKPKTCNVVFQVVRSVSACTRSFEGAGVFGVSERAVGGAGPTPAGPPGLGPGL